MCWDATLYGSKDGRSDTPATALRISRPHRPHRSAAHGQAVKDTVFAAIVCKKCSAEQLHADGLTKVKGADILPWSAEVTAVTAFPLGRALGEPTALCSQHG